MKVTDILRVKGSTLYTVSPDQLLGDAAKTVSYTHLTLPTNREV